jgi:3-oxoacyl-[acyl-carrier protein] reductase
MPSLSAAESAPADASAVVAPGAFADHVVLVSGASRGLGAAIARAFGHAGARVVVNYFQSADAAEAVAVAIDEGALGDGAEEASRALAVQADVRDPEAVQAMVDRAAAHFGAPVTVAVSNALIDFRFDADARPTADAVGWDAYHAQLEGSVRGTLNLIQACLPGMEAAGGGRVVAIGSNLVQHPVVPYHDYTTGKAALLGLVRNMAQELGPRGVTVNLVSGGLLDRTDASAATSDAVFDLIRESTPLRRVTTPEDVAGAVLFFASPWARAVTGQNLIVDGGLVKG